MNQREPELKIAQEYFLSFRDMDELLDHVESKT